LTQKVFYLENGFRDGQAVEKEEWKKLYDKEMDGIRNHNYKLLK
jgi:hypothetical protein